jgi:beta-glucosidase
VEGRSEVFYAPGCDLLDDSTDGFAEAVELAGRCDLAIAILGLSQEVEGEEGQKEGVSQGRRSRADRESLDLPGVQEALLQALHATGTPTILALINGSALAVNWADQHLPAIVELWYPGQAGGTALAEALFGDYNPGGRLPVTFYRSAEQLPPFEDYGMQGRTYRFFQGDPLYPFGYGLSYTSFRYQNLEVIPGEAGAGERIHVQVQVQNTGEMGGDEVVQLYLQRADRDGEDPLWELNGFERVYLAAGETKTVSFTLPPAFAAFRYRLERPGAYRLAVGGCSPSPRADLLTGEFFVE